MQTWTAWRTSFGVAHVLPPEHGSDTGGAGRSLRFRSGAPSLNELHLHPGRCFAGIAGLALVDETLAKLMRSGEFVHTVPLFAIAVIVMRFVFRLANHLESPPHIKNCLVLSTGPAYFQLLERRRR
jgi:hypothetical protein